MKEYKIPSMTPRVVHDYLYLTGTEWTGKGTAVELGSWLGASAAPLLTGLVEAGYNLPFYCYDMWEANTAQVSKANKAKVKIKDKQDILPLFLNNITSIYPDIKPTKGTISSTILEYPKDPIEICLFDAPKREPTFSNAMRGVLPYFIPGVTVLGLLDYYFYKYKSGKKREYAMAPVLFMEKFGGHFMVLQEWPDQGELHSCVFFKYIKELKY